MWALQPITPPAREPIALDTAKDHLRVDATDDDVLIAALITAAREYCEGFQNRVYLEQTWDLWLDDWPDEDYIRIPYPPLQSVASVKYYGTDDTEYTMDAGDYFVDAKSEPGRVALGYSKTWPTTTLRPVNAVVVRFTAGYATYAGVIDTSGTAVTWVSGDKFSTGWTAGKSIVINGVTYSVASVTSAEALVLTATAGTQNDVAYSANDVPVKLIQAMLLLVGHLFENRQAVVVDRGIIISEVPFAVKALLWQDRVVSF